MIGLKLKKDIPNSKAEQQDPKEGLNLPMDVVVRGGCLYTVDAANTRIMVTDKDTLDYIKEIKITEGGESIDSLVLRMDFDNAGNIWVVNTENARILKLDSEGEVVFEFGEYGTGEDQLDTPNGICIVDDFMYIADEFNHRVQVFNLEGEYQKSYPTGPNSYPQDIVVKDSAIYVTLTWYNCIQKISIETGEVAQTFAPLSFPRGVAVSEDGRVAGASTGEHKTIVFSPEGEIIKTIANAWNPLNTTWSMGNPIGICFDGETIYQTQALVHVVHKYALTDEGFTLAGTFGAVRDLPHQLSFPFGGSIKEDKSEIAIADQFNYRVQTFDYAGNHKRTINYAMGLDYNFVLPSDVLYGKDGKIYVCDYNESFTNGRVKVFDAEWNFIEALNLAPAATFGYFMPFRLAMDNDNNLFCVDKTMDAVHKIDLDSKQVVASYTTWANSYDQKKSIAVHPVTGEVWVVDSGLSNILRFSNDLELIATQGQYGDGEDDLFAPNDISFNESGDKMFVSDAGNFRVKVYSAEGEALQSLGSIGVEAGNFFGIVTAEAYDNNKLLTVSAYRNKARVYHYGKGHCGIGGKIRADLQAVLEKCKAMKDLKRLLKDALDAANEASAKELIVRCLDD